MPVMKTSSNKSSWTTPHHTVSPPTDMRSRRMILYHAANEGPQHSIHQTSTHLPPYHPHKPPPQAPPLAPPTKRPRPFNWPS